MGSWCRIEGVLDKDCKHGAGGITTLGAGVVVEPEVMLRNCIILPKKKIVESHQDEILI